MYMLPYARTHVLRPLKDNRPARKNGRPTKESEKSLQSNEFPAKQGNTRLYIEERLKRDHPKVWKDYLNGALDLFLAGVVYTWERLFSTFNDVLSLSKSVRIPGKKPYLQGFERWRLSLMKPLL
jgi:hypothetical protein